MQRYNYWWVGAGPSPNNYRYFRRHDPADDFWCNVISMVLGLIIITTIRIAFAIVSLPFILLYRAFAK